MIIHRAYKPDNSPFWTVQTHNTPSDWEQLQKYQLLNRVGLVCVALICKSARWTTIVFSGRKSVYKRSLNCQQKITKTKHCSTGTSFDIYKNMILYWYWLADSRPTLHLKNATYLTLQFFIHLSPWFLCIKQNRQNNRPAKHTCQVTTSCW